jgi:hypothetical protein
VAVIVLFYMLAAEVDDLRLVVAVVAFALALSVATLIQLDEGIAEYLSSFLAVIAPVAVGRLVGMQERVRIHGGRLHTGATAGGGFEVIVQLPLP